MPTQANCVRELQSFINSGVRENIRPAHSAILRHAMLGADSGARVIAMDGLLVGLSAKRRLNQMSDLQMAFDIVVVSMIERAKLVVGPGQGWS